MSYELLKFIKPEIGYYIAGFVDGEGSFNVSLRKRPDHKMGWQVVPTFNVSQRDFTILVLMKKNLGCGRFVTRKDGVHYYVVQNPTAIRERVIPFFTRFKFLSSKMKRNFMLFKQITELMNGKGHLNSDGLMKIIQMRESLNEGRGRKRKYSINHYKDFLSENPQRLNAKPRREVGDDIVRSHGRP